MLKLGSTGQDVEKLQIILNSLGVAALKVDGVFGAATEAAVKAYQQNEGLAVDGEAGPLTLAKLGITIAPSDPSNLRPYTLAWYTAMFQGLTFDHGYESVIAGAAHRVFAGKARYEAFVTSTFPHIPWYFIGLTHNMECDCNWRGVLHNGELIVGTNRRTTLVPKGRGPFATWEAAAKDAIHIEGMDKVTDWSVGNILRMGELFNGLGYQRYHKNTPYLWAMSSVNDGRGKFTSDGHYDPNANANTQCGEATILKYLVLNGQVTL